MSMHRDGCSWSTPRVASRRAGSGGGGRRSVVPAAAPWAMVLVLMLCAGCTEVLPNPRVERPAADDPVAYFQQTQANTITPNGRILLDTVQLSGPNLLRYQTEDGYWFEIHYQADPAGGFRYFSARQVAPPLDYGYGVQDG